MVATVRHSIDAWGARYGLWVGVVTILFVGLVGPGFLFLHDSPALSYLNTPFLVEHRVLRPGEPVVAWTERCNRFDRNVPYHYSRKITALGGDMRANVLTEGQGFAPPGCVRSWVPLVTLPATLAPGLYRLEAVNTVNGQWRVFEIFWWSEAFEVVSP